MRDKHILTIIIAFLSVLIGMLLFSQTGSGQQKDRSKWYYNRYGRKVAYIGTGTDPIGIATFNNSSGRQVAYIGSGTENSGMAVLYNSSGQKVAYIGCSKDVGYARFYSKSGREVAYIGSTTGGSGTIEVNGKTVHDYAEVFELATRQQVIPGTVMSMVNSGVGLAPSTESYDPKVVGVISGAGGFSPGMRIGTRKDGSNDLPIAVSGQVNVRLCLEGGSIEVGDLLVSSSQTGVAMRATDHARAFGAVIGKALEPYSGKPTESEGLVRMLVMNR
jgi:hypothetical protein